jgi:hypothetical protein
MKINKSINILLVVLLFVAVFSENKLGICLVAGMAFIKLVIEFSFQRWQIKNGKFLSFGRNPFLKWNVLTLILHMMLMIAGAFLYARDIKYGVYESVTIAMFLLIFVISILKAYYGNLMLLTDTSIVFQSGIATEKWKYDELINISIANHGIQLQKVNDSETLRIEAINRNEINELLEFLKNKIRIEILTNQFNDRNAN